MEYDVLLGWMDVQLSDPSTLASGLEIATRVRDECLPFLPDLKQAFIAQCYNISGKLHTQGKWEEVVRWASFTIEVCEKEPLEAFVALREKTLVLLCDAYIALHDDAKSLLCLQLCSHPDSVPIQFLYLKYYLLLKDLDKAVSAMGKLNALADEDDQATLLDAVRLLCEASVNANTRLSSVANATVNGAAITENNAGNNAENNAADTLSATNETCQRVWGPSPPLSRSVAEVMETHPSWKAAVRATLLCCYLRSPALCNQSLPLLGACIEGAHRSLC